MNSGGYVYDPFQPAIRQMAFYKQHKVSLRLYKLHLHAIIILYMRLKKYEELVTL